jgi:hypothetical protein
MRTWLARVTAIASVAFASLGFSTASHAAMEQAPCDTFTALGQVADDGGRMLYFGAAGGCIANKFVGSVTFTDLHHGFQLQSTRVTGYLRDPAAPNSRDLCGFAKINGQSQEVMFRIRVTENGRTDLVGITIDNWYAPERFYVVSSRAMKAGSVQIFYLPKWNVAPRGYFELQEWQMCGDISAP